MAAEQPSPWRCRCPKLPEFLHMLYHAMYVDKNRDFLMAALSSAAVRRAPAALHAPSTIHNQQQQQQQLQHQPPLQPQGGWQHSASADAGQLPARHSQVNGHQEVRTLLWYVAAACVTALSDNGLPIAATGCQALPSLPAKQQADHN